MHALFVLLLALVFVALLPIRFVCRFSIYFPRLLYAVSLKVAFVAFKSSHVLGVKPQGTLEYKSTQKKAFELVGIRKVNLQLFLPFENAALAAISSAFYSIAVDNALSFLIRTHDEGSFKKSVVVKADKSPHIEIFADFSLLFCEIVVLSILLLFENLSIKKERANGKLQKQ